MVWWDPKTTKCCLGAFYLILCACQIKDMACYNPSDIGWYIQCVIHSPTRYACTNHTAIVRYANVFLHNKVTMLARTRLVNSREDNQDAPFIPTRHGYDQVRPKIEWHDTDWLARRKPLLVIAWLDLSTTRRRDSGRRPIFSLLYVHPYIHTYVRRKGSRFLSLSQRGRTCWSCICSHAYNIWIIQPTGWYGCVKMRQA